MRLATSATDERTRFITVGILECRFDIDTCPTVSLLSLARSKSFLFQFLGKCINRHWRMTVVTAPLLVSFMQHLACAFGRGLSDASVIDELTDEIVIVAIAACSLG